MARKSIQALTLGSGLVGGLCWVVMFLAGTDVWHDVGRPDFWNLAGVPYNDLRAFAAAFYLLFAVLALNLIMAAVNIVTTWRGARNPA